MDKDYRRMWHTSYGDRTLNADEAVVFLESVGYMRDMISVAVELNESHQTGVALFDSLQPTQQLAALHCVATALLSPDAEAPPLCATLEATVFAVFRELLLLVEIELDGFNGSDPAGRCPDFEIRTAIINALRSPVIGDGDFWIPEDDLDVDFPEATCTDLDRWEHEIENLANRILWDRDFELEFLLADQDPLKTAAIKNYLGISDDYFATPSPDAGSEEYQRLDRELVDLKMGSPALFHHRRSDDDLTADF